MNKVYFSTLSGQIIAVTSGTLELENADFIYSARDCADLSDFVVVSNELVRKFSAQHLSSSLCSIEDKATGARQLRDKLLSDTDWTQVVDNALTQTQRDSWKGYRQSLRDVTLQQGFPSEIIWPDAPRFDSDDS